MSKLDERRAEYAWLLEPLREHFGADNVRDQLLTYDLGYGVALHRRLADGVLWRWGLKPVTAFETADDGWTIDSLGDHCKTPEERAALVQRVIKRAEQGYAAHNKGRRN